MEDVEAGIVYRGWVPESHHRARIAITGTDGQPQLALGDVASPMLPRSALKPFQALAMLDAGLDLGGPHLALAAGSHAGERIHLDGVAEILDGAGLGADLLHNTADLPTDEATRVEWILAGRGRESVAHMCSGKHAAMLRTCIRAGWPVDEYLDAAHPLQLAIHDVVQAYCGISGESVVDGCRAPAFPSTLAGLAAGYGKLASAAEGPARAVADAFREHPEYTAATGSPTVVVHREVPQIVMKTGAEGVLAAGLSDGTGIAIKMSDGMGRGSFDVLRAVLQSLGHDVPGLTAELVIAPALQEALSGSGG